MTRNTPFKPGYISISSIGYGGSNAHAVVKPPMAHQKNCKSLQQYKHRLVFASGRTQDAVNHFLNGTEKNKEDYEFLSLVDEIHKMNVERHEYRG